MLELSNGLEFDSGRTEEFFSALPARAAVCLIEPKEEKAEPFLIRTADLRHRLQRLLGPPDPASKRLNLRGFARAVRYRATGSAFEQALAYYQHARQHFPKRYRDLIRLRPPAVLKVNLRNAYPRCYVTRRIAVDDTGAPTAGVYYGPFASRRAAQAFAERALDFFKVRRCQIKIRRDPAFPGCLYSEMKMCLAPCFAGCTKEEYDAEVNRLLNFLGTSGGSLVSSLEQERSGASEGLDFELAANLHKRLEKLNDVLRLRPELADEFRTWMRSSCSGLPRSRRSAYSPFAVGGSPSRCFCALRRWRASRARRKRFCAIEWNRLPPIHANISTSICGLLRAGITATRARGRSSSETLTAPRSCVKRSGRTAAYFGLAPACWRQKRRQSHPRRTQKRTNRAKGAS